MLKRTQLSQLSQVSQVSRKTGINFHGNITPHIKVPIVPMITKKSRNPIVSIKPIKLFPTTLFVIPRYSLSNQKYCMSSLNPLKKWVSINNIKNIKNPIEFKQKVIAIIDMALTTIAIIVAVGLFMLISDTLGILTGILFAVFLFVLFTV